MMLVLFDIDGTMLSSEGVGVRSMEEVGEVLYGKRFSLKGIPIGGRLDPLIWNDICLKYGISNPESRHDEFKSTYIEILQKNIKEVCVNIFAGVSALINRCCEQEDVMLGITTGNYEETGKMKLHAAGIDSSIFTANAWGLDGAVRTDLPKFAMSQCQAHKHVVLLGDTVHDVRSGQANGCKTIAVCTGSHDRDTLKASNPDLLLEDLSNVKEVFQWIIQFHNQ